ncbi:aminotransferase A [Mangrovibacillus cuniculi]|uniref:Aminotransferase n=1 Tax=Mangrovibacillus cuniculi TaxID=2593652 RepID=A0A7S8HEW9_9BACI|nr:aminotransferase A [Mangrovibacillus cuniculi]QPC46162.1 aminotransferase A [Mangrovibacillus cuniculi]
MQINLSPKVQSIQISGIRQFMSEIASIKDCLSFTIGQPDFPTPDHVREAAKDAIDAQFTSYTVNAGDLRLREAAVKFVEEKYGLNYNPNSEVIITVGASQAIDATLRTLLEADDEVLLPVPIYPGYEPIIIQCGAKPVYMDTTKTQFKVTPELIKGAMTKKTKCIILPYPSNPTGVTLSEEEVHAIAEVVKDRSIMVIADEIYSELTYDQEHTSIATYLPDQTVVINGLSKSHSMTGWRIGLLFGPTWLLREVLKVHQYTVSCASSISQAAALQALTVGKNDALPMRDAYKERRNYMQLRLEQIGFEVIKPGGAFYFFVKIPTHVDLSSYDFCIDVAHKAKVAMIPGSAFSTYGEGYVRLSYACSMETIEEGMDRIEGYFQINERKSFEGSKL